VSGPRSFDEGVDGIRKEDPRYSREAYVFIQLALDFYREHHGDETTTHITGPELLRGVRELAMAQYGPMARQVLNHWGLQRGEDVGDVVYNLIRHGLMSSSDEDEIEDFHGIMVFDDSMNREFSW